MRGQSEEEVRRKGIDDAIAALNRRECENMKHGTVERGPHSRRPEECEPCGGCPGCAQAAKDRREVKQLRAENRKLLTLLRYARWAIHTDLYVAGKQQLALRKKARLLKRIDRARARNS